MLDKTSLRIFWATDYLYKRNDAKPQQLELLQFYLCFQQPVYGEKGFSSISNLKKSKRNTLPTKNDLRIVLNKIEPGPFYNAKTVKI